MHHSGYKSVIVTQKCDSTTKPKICLRFFTNLIVLKTALNFFCLERDKSHNREWNVKLNPWCILGNFISLMKNTR